MKNKFCYLCGGVAATRDHVPPKSFFETPRPGNLITVPACEKCNTRFSKDEEWFRSHILAMSYSDRGRRLWTDKVLKAFNRKPNLAYRMRSNLIKLNTGNTAIKINKERANIVVKKIVHGLFFNHFEEKVKDNLQWEISLNPRNNLLERYKKYSKFFSVQDDAFRYAFACGDVNINQSSIWWLQFHNNALFVICIVE